MREQLKMHNRSKEDLRESKLRKKSREMHITLKKTVESLRYFWFYCLAIVFDKTRRSLYAAV